MQPPCGKTLLALWLAASAAVAAPPAGPAPAAVRVRVVGPRPVDRPSPPVPPSALALYQQRCASCHGTTGRGDGPAAAGLMVKPRRFSDAFWQDSESDAVLTRAILEGGFAVRKSSAMPAHPDLKGDIAGLIAVVRSFRSPTGSVAAQTLRENGEVIATFTAEIDGAGNGVVVVKSLPPDAVAVAGRVSGHPQPVCRVALPTQRPPSELTCAAEVASLAPPHGPPVEPPAEPAASPPVPSPPAAPQEPR